MFKKFMPALGFSIRLTMIIVLVSKHLVNTHFIIVFCSGSFLLISLLPVNDYYAISLLSRINFHLSKDSLSIIATKSSLLNRS